MLKTPDIYREKMVLKKLVKTHIPWIKPLLNTIKNRHFKLTASLGGSVEFIGLPGSGKHIVAPIFRSELSKHGWALNPSSANLFNSNSFFSKDSNEAFSCLLEQQARRLREDGCKLPYLSEYMRHTASILSRSWSWRMHGSLMPSCFMNESLLHHFGPEIVTLLAPPRPPPQKNIKQINYTQLAELADRILGNLNRRFVIMTTSPRLEVLQRLESRRGQEVSWDWVSAYGERLDEFLDNSEDRLHALVEVLEKHGAHIIKVEVRGEVIKEPTISFIRDLVLNINKNTHGV